MQINRRFSRRVLIVIGAAALLAIGSSRPRSPWLLYNRTPSMPTGFYLYDHQAPIHRGDVVALLLPRPAHHYARLRGEPTDVLLLKHVLAVRGDFVCTLHRELRVNGVLVGPIAVADSLGRPLPQWRACRRLSGDELLVGSSQPHSFDSRYFGPIHASQVLGVYRPLAFSFSSNPHRVDESLNDSLIDHAPPIARCAFGGKSNYENSEVTRREDESCRAR